MGKIRVNTIGDQEVEQKQREEAEKRRAAKKTEKSEEKTAEEPTTDSSEEPKKKVVKKKASVTKVRSPKYTEVAKLRDKSKLYALSEALEVLEKMKRAKFDETVELHINTIDKLNGSVVLPHGTGKETKVAILAPTKDAAGAEKLLKDIEAGKIDFDVLIATPDAMPRLAKVARVLGPRGLMPNPKSGTITPKPEEVAQKFKGGQVNFKTEVKANVIHVSVGKMSFGNAKLHENIAAFLGALDNSKIKNVFLKSTMSPSLKLTR
ncbi:MAG: 50S ribosomal protein L1 [Patescibacteria group bacterium]|nr:50S ribosomal protein L1 [Patescibacteria group bacterium]MDE2590826.1 50S ribosomal protein L1 [Patescibacteria group bacterium]